MSVQHTAFCRMFLSRCIFMEARPEPELFAGVTGLRIPPGCGLLGHRPCRICFDKLPRYRARHGASEKRRTAGRDASVTGSMPPAFGMRATAASTVLYFRSHDLSHIKNLPTWWPAGHSTCIGKAPLYLGLQPHDLSGCYSSAWFRARAASGGARAPSACVSHDLLWRSLRSAHLTWKVAQNVNKKSGTPDIS